MKFGVNILNFGSGATPPVMGRWALAAEELGYHFLMISDHVAVTEDVQARYPVPFYDPFVVLAWFSGITKKVELGTTVAILPYRNALQTARMAANIDQLSGGRFIFGVGAGWARQEFEALGVPFERRGAISDECLSTIIDHWSKKTVLGNGRVVWTGPTPASSPHPPVWVGGSSAPALRRAVRYGDAWHPIHSRMSWLREEGLPQLRRFAEAEGRRSPAFCPRIHLRITEKPLDDGTRLPGEGTLDQVRGDLESLESLGAQYVLFDTYTGAPAERKDPDADWSAFATLAEKVLDLRRQSLR